jgi:hypothetical protein
VSTVAENGDGQVRERVMSQARTEIRVLAEDGLSIEAIESQLLEGTNKFNETERELVRLIVRSEVAGTPEHEARSKSVSGGKRASKTTRAGQQKKNR